MLRLNLICAIALILVIVLAVGAPAAQESALAGKGKTLVADHRCAMCHMIDGKGGKLAKPLDGVIDRRDAAGIRRVLADPLKELPDAKIKMPRVEWKAGEMDAVVAYLQTLKAVSAK
jgi:cytochrome c2